MHFAYYKLVVSTNPHTQRYYTLYTTLLIFLQLYILLALLYHLRATIASNDGLDASFIFHMFLGWLTSVMNVGRLFGHVDARGWDSYVRTGFRVGRFDGVVAAAWALPYLLLPFAIFGDYRYVGLAYLIPLPMIFGYALARWLHIKIDAAYRAGGGYTTLDDQDADIQAEEGSIRPADTELPEYEAVQRDSSREVEAEPSSLRDKRDVEV
ncbi:hypothetical protein ABW21_db0208420 [Orbilia brochopaga]|nr:hypothetical protein ABW21_db0208420 [Drechslerella brochopaga]